MLIFFFPRFWIFFARHVHFSRINLRININRGRRGDFLIVENFRGKLRGDRNCAGEGTSLPTLRLAIVRAINGLVKTGRNLINREQIGLV